MFSWRNMETVRGEAGGWPTSTDAASLTFRASWVDVQNYFCNFHCFLSNHMLLVHSASWQNPVFPDTNRNLIEKVCPDSWDLQMDPDLSGRVALIPRSDSSPANILSVCVRLVMASLCGAASLFPGPFSAAASEHGETSLNVFRSSALSPTCWNSACCRDTNCWRD